MKETLTEAQYILGSMYAQGKGVLQDYAQAHAWFNLAASQGHDKASVYRDEIAQKIVGLPRTLDNGFTGRCVY